MGVHWSFTRTAGASAGGCAGAGGAGGTRSIALFVVKVVLIGCMWTSLKLRYREVRSRPMTWPTRERVGKAMSSMKKRGGMVGPLCASLY